MKKPIIIGGIAVPLVVIVGFAIYALTSGGAQAGNGSVALAGTAVEAINNGIAPNNETANDVNAIGLPANALTDHLVGLPGGETVSSIYTGSDGTLYAFTGNTGNTIYALDSNGKLTWSYDVPVEWRVLNSFAVKIYDPSNYEQSNPAGMNMAGYLNFEGTTIKPVFANDEGVLYLYIRENKTTRFNHGLNDEFPIQPETGDWLLKERLLAISSDGQLLWDVPISDVHHVYDDASIIAKNGRVYVYEDYTVTVLDRDGTVLFKIQNISGRPAVDEDGHIYVVPGIIADPQPSDLTDYFLDSGYRVPSNAVDAYDPDGTLYWHKDIDAQVVRQGDRSLPLYQNGTLWVPVANGVWAMNIDGTIKWEKQYDGYTALYRVLPLDSHDNIYLYQLVEIGSYLRGQYHVISSDGNEILCIGYSDNTIYPGSAVSADVNDGTIYSVQLYITGDSDLNTDLMSLFTVNMTAYNFPGDKVLWDFTFEPNVTETTITSDNVGRLLTPVIQSRGYVGDIYHVWSLDHGSVNPIRILPGNGVVYVTYQAANYEWPIVVGQSKVAYCSEIYAFDKNNGTLLWNKPLDTMISSVTVNNSTLYYGTGDGKIIVQQIGGVVGGLTAVAASYLFIRFFLLGAISRAKDRINKNENRLTVLKYIADNPGSTLRDISRGLGINLGTIRYHMLILGINHRVVGYRADDKHVRYFTNSNSYSKEEQFIISLMRRDGIRNIFKALIESPGISNTELSNKLGMRVSSTGRYMKELSEKGIVNKVPGPGCTYAYSIKDDKCEPIATFIKRFYDS